MLGAAARLRMSLPMFGLSRRLAQQGLARLPAQLAVHVPLLQGLVPRSVLPGAAYTIVGGNPARAIKRRFPEAIADRLAELGWWDWNHETLRLALPDFRKLAVEAFLEKYEAIARAQRAASQRQKAAS